MRQTAIIPDIILSTGDGLAKSLKIPAFPRSTDLNPSLP